MSIFPNFVNSRIRIGVNQAPVIPGAIGVTGVSGTVSVTGSALVYGFATSATPSYTNSTTQALSLNLAGALRTTVTNTVSVAGTVTVSNTVSITGSVTVIGGTITGSFGAGGTATAAAPSYSEGTTNALSLNLAGDLRTVVSAIAGALPTGSNVLGTVTVSGITNAVTANPTTSASWTTSQVTVTAGATQIIAASVGTLFKEIINPTTSNATVFVGTSAVTTGSGHFLIGGSAMDWSNHSGAIFGISATGSVTVSTMMWG
jgi:hypothetical protein